MDRAKVVATGEAKIRPHQAEDGQDDDTAGFPPVYPAAEVRRRLGLSHAAFASALAIPITALRDLERGRTAPDEVRQSLLRAVATDPAAVLNAIAGRARAPTRGDGPDRANLCGPSARRHEHHAASLVRDAADLRLRKRRASSERSLWGTAGKQRFVLRERRAALEGGNVRHDAS